MMLKIPPLRRSSHSPPTCTTMADSMVILAYRPVFYLICRPAASNGSERRDRESCGRSCLTHRGGFPLSCKALGFRDEMSSPMAHVDGGCPWGSQLCHNVIERHLIGLCQSHCCALFQPQVHSLTQCSLSALVCFVRFSVSFWTLFHLLSRARRSPTRRLMAMDSRVPSPSRMSARRIAEGPGGLHHTMLDVVELAIFRLDRYLKRHRMPVKPWVMDWKRPRSGPEVGLRSRSCPRGDFLGLPAPRDSEGQNMAIANEWRNTSR
ncbi:hypothetical protein KC19_3G111200 [Ceratodon purpureus]|uniref:Uncharacterized protein n=1 Tax=Ceratodon purpureus TaxID=3225 RepID=A0A8T0IKZ5_CERPU|nr:hypothetical protein KC19_3G111200 [Ceratodon purpureus]